jgi:hypothetical protein
MQRETPSAKLPFGSKIPSFSLPSTDGRTITEGYLAGAKAALVVFSCNHCPYVKGSEEMLISTIRRFEPEGLKAVMIRRPRLQDLPSRISTTRAKLLPVALMQHVRRSVIFSMPLANSPIMARLTIIPRIRRKPLRISYQ